MIDYPVTHWNVGSFDSRNDTIYDVIQYHSGDYTCSCPAFRFHADSECKHIRAVQRTPSLFDREHLPIPDDAKPNILAVHDILIRTITYSDGTQKVKVTDLSE